MCKQAALSLTLVCKLAAEPRRHRGNLDGVEVLWCVDVFDNCSCVTPQSAVAPLLRLEKQQEARRKKNGPTIVF